MQAGQGEEAVLAGLISELNEAGAREVLVRLRLLAQAPELYETRLAARQAGANVKKLATVLDLTSSLGAEKRFLAAAMTFCNGLATRYGCDQVSLGWLEGGYVRLRAMSRTEKFDRQMAAAQALEAAMEEALDQDEEVVWPRPEGATVITRDHERFTRDQKVEHLGSPAVARGKEAGGGNLVRTTDSGLVGNRTAADAPGLRCGRSAPGAAAQTRPLVRRALGGPIEGAPGQTARPGAHLGQAAGAGYRGLAGRAVPGPGPLPGRGQVRAAQRFAGVPDGAL